MVARQVSLSWDFSKVSLQIFTNEPFIGSSAQFKKKKKLVLFNEENNDFWGTLHPM